MLKRVLLGAFFIFLFSRVFCADTVPQKIALSIDSSSKFYSIELMLQQAILGAASSFKSVVLIPGGFENLETIGIKEVNANLLLKLERAYDKYIVNIYSVEQTTNVLIDNSLQFKVNNLSSSINNISSTILDIITLRFPPKPIKELKKIEVVKVQLSEFELPVPSFKIKVLPLFNVSKMKTELALSNDLGYYQCGNFSSPILFSPYLEASYQYRALNASLGVGYSFGGGEEANSFCAFSDFIIGYGLFQSLIVMGIQGFFDYGTFTSSYGINTNKSGITGAPTIGMPDVSFYNLLFGPYIRVNITKDYFVELAVCIPGFGLQSMKVRFKDETLKPPLGDTVPIGDSDGPPFLKIRFNWRLWERFHLILNYSFFVCGFDSDFREDARIKPVPLDENKTIFLMRIGVSQSLIGVGLIYEL